MRELTAMSDKSSVTGGQVVAGAKCEWNLKELKQLLMIVQKTVMN